MDSITSKTDWSEELKRLTDPNDSPTAVLEHLKTKSDELTTKADLENVIAKVKTFLNVEDTDPIVVVLGFLEDHCETRLKQMEDAPASPMDSIASDNNWSEELKGFAKTTNKSEARTLYKGLDATIDQLAKDDVKGLLAAIQSYADLKKLDRKVLYPLLTRFEVHCENNLKKLEKVPPSPGGRIADLAYGIAGTSLAHTHDLTKLVERVIGLFKWHKNEEERNEYQAPYFPIVQSSGMGKTKLLYELRSRMSELEIKKSKKEEKIYCCLLILVGQVKPDIYNGLFTVKAIENEEEKAGDNKYQNYTNVATYLDEMIAASRGEGCKKVILLFDEAQGLLEKDAVLFRSICWYLREKRSYEIVAVFTGTNSKLTSYFTDAGVKTGNSRDVRRSYLGKGVKLYDPFFRLHTLNCVTINEEVVQNNPGGTNERVHDELHQEQGSKGICEYHESIGYGRPLFASMYKGGSLGDDVHHNILHRILLSTPIEEWSVQAHLSVLATRVQMGQTTFSVLSNLVANGYATLTNFVNTENDARADMAYLTDPVCARLAMCVMDEDWKSKNKLNTSIRGKDKKHWVEEMCKAFSTGLCRPPKGDAGEVFAAFYMLLCGDELRKEANTEYTQFSVSLAKWLQGLASKAGEVSPADSKRGAVDKAETCNKKMSEVDDAGCEPTVSFIQVCRNYIRFPLKKTATQGFLKHLYKSGCAVYVYSNCPTFDILAAIYHKGKYYPMLVSIKARDTFSQKKMEKNLDDMKSLLLKGELPPLPVKAGTALSEKDVASTKEKNLSDNDTSDGKSAALTQSSKSSDMGLKGKNSTARPEFAERDDLDASKGAEMPERQLSDDTDTLFDKDDLPFRSNRHVKNNDLLSQVENASTPTAQSQTKRAAPDNATNIRMKRAKYTVNIDLASKSTTTPGDDLSDDDGIMFNKKEHDVKDDVTDESWVEGGLGLLLMLGRKYKKTTICTKLVNELKSLEFIHELDKMDKNPVVIAIDIPNKDKFGLTSNFQESICLKDELSEIYTSHGFVPFYEQLEGKDGLRKSSGKCSVQKEFDLMKDALKDLYHKPLSSDTASIHSTIRDT